MGQDCPNSQWILTPFDTWEKNPCYVGPDQPHPEDNCSEPVQSDSYAERTKFDAQFEEWRGDSNGSVGCD